MYNNNNFKIRLDWKNILIKLTLIILSIVLLAWAIPMPKLDTFYNRVFSENINNMKEVAKNYFSNNNLPENIGESETIKLSDMINKNLIIEFVDKNNEKCNETSSYSTITKTGSDEYVLKTQLSCNNDSDYILETISNTINKQDDLNNNTGNSNTNNNNNSINNEDDDEEDIILENGIYDKDGNLISIIEYEFKKPVYTTTNNYTCPSGYVLNGKTCYKYERGKTIPATPLYFDDTKIIKDAEKNVTGSYTEYADPIKEKDKVVKKCPDGYTLNNNICYKYEEATVKPGTTIYECPAGYSVKGTKCIKKVEPDYKLVSKDDYVCPDGYTLNGDKCTITKNALISSETSKEYYCNYSSDRLVGTSCFYDATYHSGGTNCTCNIGDEKIGNTCYKKEEYNANYVSGSQNCSCPDGYRLSNSQCVYSYTATNNSHWGNPTVIKSNTLRAEYNNGKEKLEYTGNYSCSLGSCVYYYNLYKWESSYICNKGGSLSGTTCYIYKNPTCSSTGGYYTCSDGSTPVNNKCYRTTTYNATCSTTNGYYSCSRQGILLGSSCSYSANYRYNSSSKEYCESGYILNNHKCTKTIYADIIIDDKVIPYCNTSEGYYLENEMCVKTIDATKNTTSTEYICPDGYIKEGTTCYKTTEPTEEIEYKYTCPDGYTKYEENGNYKCSKVVESKTEYYCEDKDAVLENDKCIIIKKGGLKGYTCPDDYILNGDTCVLEKTTCFDATLETNTTTSYTYTWSTKKELEGWIPTGNTRTKDPSEYIK